MEESSANINQDTQVEQANKLFQTATLLLFGRRKIVEKAIKCIQRAITIDNVNYKYWQFLGEAYYQRGSLNPAINCFAKSLELMNSNPDGDQEESRQTDRIYSKTRMSDIRFAVGHLEEAAAGYDEIINQEPDNFAALVGLCKTKLQMSRNSFSAGLVKMGHSDCMLALKYALRATRSHPNLCLTWKLAADCCLIQFVLGQKDQFTATIDQEFPGSHGEQLIIDRKVCIDLAQQFLCRCLSISPFQTSGCLWHNLGISLYLKATIVKDESERESLLTRSLKCLIKALDMDRGNSQIRNSIGVVAFNLNLLNTAQSFVISSIETNMSTSEVQFSNLGYMYLQKGLFDLASVAFSRCQAEEPLYSRSWLGNALIASHNNLDNLSQLRHCNRLDNIYEPQLLFATKAACLPHKKDYERDVINALDSLIRVINYNPSSVEANNTLGLLYERCNHLGRAKECFERAFRCSPQDSRLIFNMLRQSRNSVNVKTSENPLDSNLIKMAEKFANGGNRSHVLNFIFHLFSNGEFKKVNEKMTKLMDRLPQEDLSSKTGAQILLGLSAKAENGDFKSWLYKNLIDLEKQKCIESVINLLCLMLFGSSQNDDELVEQVSQNLIQNIVAWISSKDEPYHDSFQSQDSFWLRLTLLASIFCLKNQSKLIQSMLALFPTEAELWLYLGLALSFQKDKQQVAIQCLNKASLIGSSRAELVVVCDILRSMFGQSEKGCHLIKTRQKYLSRAIHKDPNHMLLWEYLLKPSDGSSSMKGVDHNAQSSFEKNSSLLYLAIDKMIGIS